MTSLIVTCLVLFLCVASLLLSEAWATAAGSRSINKVLSGKGHLSVLIGKYLSGIFIFITACWYYPGLPMNHAEVFQPIWNGDWSFACILLMAIACVIGYKSAENISPKHQRVALRSTAAITYLFIRIVFLVLYECFCRGVLLYTFLDYPGIITAILINLIIYALLHGYSEQKEIIGTLPFGLLLCLVTLLHHSVWPAILIHLSLAMSHEATLVLKKHPPLKSWKL